MSDDAVMSFDEGNAACPFVAFQDDRDHRSDFADSRHRCYAAAEPEPRDTSHQERFCLSVAFAACPVFLEWARAEAAGVSGGRAVSAAGGAAGFAAITAAGKAASRAASDTPAFLANRGRTTPAEAAPVTAHASDPGSGLWGFEGAPKRTVAPASAPATALSGFDMGTPPMARRQPTKPDWENPPKYDNFPRLRARDDRNNNQPLLLAALGVAVLMVALILVPLITPKGSGGVSQHSATASDGGSGVVASGGSPSATPSPQQTLMVYVITKKDRSLSQIAIDHGIPLGLLEAANPIDRFPSGNYNIIYPGMQIFIPWQTWVPSPSPSPTPTPTPYITPFH